jgi:hypothetical protein
MKKIIALALFFLLIISVFIICGQNNEILNVKLNYDSSRIFLLEKRTLQLFSIPLPRTAIYRLYICDLQLKHKQLILESKSIPKSILPNPKRNIILFTIDDQSGKHLLYVFDCNNQRFILEKKNYNLPSWDDDIKDRGWYSNGRLFVFYDKGCFKFIDFTDPLRIKFYLNPKFPKIPEDKFYCFDWEEQKGILMYTFGRELKLLNLQNGVEKNYISAKEDEFFKQIYLLGNNQLLCISGGSKEKIELINYINRTRIKLFSSNKLTNNIHILAQNIIFFSATWGNDYLVDTNIIKMNINGLQQERLAHYNDYDSLWDYNPKDHGIVYYSNKNRELYIVNSNN